MIWQLLLMLGALMKMKFSTLRNQVAFYLHTPRYALCLRKRMLHYLYMYMGANIYFGEALETIKEDLNHALNIIPQIREEFWNNVHIPGKNNELNVNQAPHAPSSSSSPLSPPNPLKSLTPPQAS